MTEDRHGDAWEATARTLVAAMVAKPQPRPSETVLALLTYDMVPQWFRTQSTGSQSEILERWRDRFREGARPDRKPEPIQCCCWPGAECVCPNQTEGV
jgi:hypothetical protein